MAKAPKGEDQFSEKESQRRFEAALRGGLKTPPRPHSEMKLGSKKARPQKPKKKAGT